MSIGDFHSDELTKTEFDSRRAKKTCIYNSLSTEYNFATGSFDSRESQVGSANSTPFTAKNSSFDNVSPNPSTAPDGRNKKGQIEISSKSEMNMEAEENQPERNSCKSNSIALHYVLTIEIMNQLYMSRTQTAVAIQRGLVDPKLYIVRDEDEEMYDF